MKSRHTKPLLSAEEEIDLARRIHGADQADSLAARNELVLTNLGLVGTVATWFLRRWPRSDYDDLFAEGCVGLVEAAATFDPERGTRFTSYAYRVITHRLVKYLRRSGPVVQAGLAGVTPVDPSPSAFLVLCQVEDQTEILRALAKLPPLRAYVLAYRYGLCGLSVRSLTELGRELGVCRERVRQIEVSARVKLGRALLKARQDDKAARKRCA